MGTLDSRKQLFEGLLWEHGTFPRPSPPSSGPTASAKLKRKSWPFNTAANWKPIGKMLLSLRINDQAGLQHARVLKEAIAAGDAKERNAELVSEEATSSPPEHEDTGASNMGAGSEDTGRPEPLVPSAPEITPQSPATSAKTSSAPPPTSSPAKDAPAPPPASAPKPPRASRKGSRKHTEITAEELSDAITIVAPPAGGSQAQALVLHAGRAAVTAGEKVSVQLGRIVELTHGEANLGSLQDYVDKWNRADLSAATRGVDKDKQPVVDNSGPRSTVQHFSRLKRAMKEFDTAWHDANANVVATLDSRKQLFEGLLWEHRDLSEAFTALERTHGKCQATLPETSLQDLAGQIAALKAEKEELAVQHRRKLEAHRKDAAELKDQLIQAGLQHARVLKEAIAAGDAKVEEARKEFADAAGQLRKELEEETKLLQQAQERNAELVSEEATSSPPEHEDTGASNMGAGSEDTGRPEPLVPSAPEITPQSPATSAKTSSAPPPTSSPAKDAPAPPPASAPKPPRASRKGSRKHTEITAEELSDAITIVAPPAGGSQAQALVLHAGRAAVTAGEKVSVQLGRIVELTHGEANLGSLQDYVDKWNRADLSAATRGVDKDKQPVVDNSGPRSTVQHFSRLKRAMKEFDTAWHDANANVVIYPHSPRVSGHARLRKQLFEGLLWEHRDLSEAFTALERTHGKCQATLPETSLQDLAGQIAALKAEKEELAVQHRRKLEAHRKDAAELKDQLIQAGLQHARVLKEAIAAGDAKVEEARKEFADAAGQLRKELEEETKLLQQAQERNAELVSEEATSSPPEHEDTGASNMGAGSEDTGRPEPLVPSAPEITPQSPATSAKTSSAPPPTSSPAKDAPAPPPASAPKPPRASRKGSRKHTEITAEELSDAITIVAPPAGGSQAQALVLHAGRAAVTAGEKVSVQLGRIVELTRGEANLGSLQDYVDKWNRADLSAATRGVDKDKQPVVDNSGPRSTVQHFSRLKRAMKEFDTAWHDANANVVGTLDSRKHCSRGCRGAPGPFRGLHRPRADPRQVPTTLPETSLQDLAGQIAALKAEKEELAVQHRRKLEAHRKDAAELKDQLIQAGLQHARVLKEAIAAGDAKVEEARKEFADAAGQLRKELEEDTKLLQQAQERNAELVSDQVSLDRIIIDTDAQALKFFPDSQEHAHGKVTQLRAENAVSDPGAPWNAYDHLAALHARITHMRVIDRHLGEVPEVALQVFKFLWSGEPVPNNLTLLAKRLKDAGKRFCEWRCSAARAGADAALRVACSWYEDLDLDALHNMRANAPTDMDPKKTAQRRDHAYRIAQFASTSTFIPPPADLADEFSDEEEEEEEAGEDEVEAEVIIPEEAAAGPPRAIPRSAGCPRSFPRNPCYSSASPKGSSPLYRTP
ncbi:hypothetical protein QYE76_053149 [Lolium multiflorum]|uniref:Uncharacterized protein n=1 Tax=Lolium multiflorum TaxID=4521 RepID=A0AAD8WM88_LOLMU|nr:hypothetical protein QYE76_053149 [Lolium multiflorum]